MSGQLTQGRTADPIDGPFVHRDRAQRLVKADRRLVPVQYPPLQPGVALPNAFLGERDEHRLAQSRTTSDRADVQVLQVYPVHAVPRGEILEPQRAADHL